jgi:hypothetical protein
MAHSVVLNPHPLPAVMPASLPPRRAVHISEQKVFADLGRGEEHAHGKWVLDSDAMNHVTDAKELFAELDTQIYGTVKFGDGSITRIEGWGTI